MKSDLPFKEQKSMRSKKKTSKSIRASNEFATLEVDGELKPIDDKIASSTEGAEVEDAELDELLGEKSKDEIIEKASSSKFLARLTPEMAEKLEKIDSLEKHCLELEEENAKLTDSVNSYLEELDVLKKKRGSKSTSDVEESLTELGDDLTGTRHELAEMRRQLKDLHEENDGYLMKISELTFENAKLTSQIQELEKSMIMVSTPTHGTRSVKPATLKPSTGTLKNQPQFANPYLQNGYRDW